MAGFCRMCCGSCWLKGGRKFELWAWIRGRVGVGERGRGDPVPRVRGGGVSAVVRLRVRVRIGGRWGGGSPGVEHHGEVSLSMGGLRAGELRVGTHEVVKAGVGSHEAVEAGVIKAGEVRTVAVRGGVGRPGAARGAIVVRFAGLSGRRGCGGRVRSLSVVRRGCRRTRFCGRYFVSRVIWIRRIGVR
jgi:hypothetical protein